MRFSLEKEDEHRRRLIIRCYLACLLIPLAFALDDLLQGKTDRLINYGSAAVVVIVVIILLMRFSSPRLWSSAAFLTLAVGIPLALISPRSRYIEMLLFLSCVPFSFYLQGTKTGLLWALFYFVEFAVFWTLGSIGWIPNWTLKYSNPVLPVSLWTFFVLVVLNLASSRQYDRNLRALRRANLHYPISGFYRRQKLIEDLEELQRVPTVLGMLAFLRLENQHELSLVHGYGFNEEIIRCVSAFLREYAPSKGARYYQLRDNEYALLLTNEGVQGLGEADLQILHDHVEVLSFSPGGPELRLQSAIGAVKLTKEVLGVALTLGDRALQMAIKTHSDVHYYDPEEDSLDNTFDKLQRFAHLRKTLESDSLVVHFQPVCDAVTLEPVWYEALTRIPTVDGQLGSIYPYLPIAEATGQMPRITKVVIEAAARFIDTHKKPVSINLSLQDILNPTVVHHLAEKARSRATGSFILEILERDDLSDIQDFPSFVDVTRRAGCLIAIDDFGTGYSNFSTLIDLSLDYVKIDGALVKKSKTDPKALALIKTLIQFCKHAELKIVAEHIDEGDQILVFRSLGVDYLQGYFLGEPESR